SFSGPNALDGEGTGTNATSATPFPTGTYTPPGPGDAAPAVSTVSPANTATDVAINADIVVTFSEDVTVAGSWYDITCTSSGTVTATVTGGPLSFTLNPDADLGSLETCTVTVFAAQVTDADTDDPPDNMDADFVSSFTTEDTTPPPSGGSDLIITGVIDGPLTGGIPKAIELYVTNDIADLSSYGIGSANNGGGTDGEEFTFPAVSATAGDYIYVASEAVAFADWFGFAPNYTSSAASVNGDDAIELFESGAVIDTFGDIDVDGNGEPWEYLDGWAYRVDGTGPDGATFVLANWTFSGPNALDGESDNATAATPFPVGTYAPPAAPLVLSGVIDATLTGGIPKAIELYVGQDIADLSIYGIGSANNGGGTDGEEFTFPADSATAGDYIYVASEAVAFADWFGFAPNYTSSAASVNGDDAIELFESGAVIDTFGDINTDGSGEPWEYLDGWAYRVDGTGPDGTTFVLANWTFSGPNALDGESDNATAATPFPVGTYSPVANPGDIAPSVASTTPT
ncbi:MAG: Ig-like domain-containing protein, partial [Aestuariibacter sp.]|nr:Ig-like domain-containing protein [Aestuariibacter sp.]